MKKIILSAVALTAIIATSCQSDNNSVNEVINTAEKSQLEVYAGFSRDVSTRSVTGRPIDAFVNGDEVGLFITNGTGVNNVYNGVASNKNMKATKNTRWGLATPVYLSSANATVYSYFPYSAGVTDGTQLSVDHTSQTDFLYGSPVTGINNRNVKANINFNHALTLVQFHLKKGTYTGVGRLTAISIENAPSKQSLKSTAKLNITNGQLVKGNETTAVTKATNLPAQIGASWTEDKFVKSLVIPTDNGAEGDILVKFTIDGQVFTMKVPADHAWEQGKKNTYTITLNGNGMDISSSDVQFNVNVWGGGKAGDSTFS